MSLTTAEFREREAAARALYSPCRLCSRFCDVDRTKGELGPCGVGDEVLLGGWGIHLGEEPELTGKGGSGLVLLGGCNLACAGCETFDISRERRRVRKATPAELAGVLLELQKRGAETVQFVTPTHQVPAIVSAIRRASERGFDRPIVWNCGGYESLDALRVLDGIVDVYLPDLKHGDDAEGKLAGVMDYWTVAKECLREMHRQVGALRIDADGLARRGLMIRHLVLPDDAARTREVMRFVASVDPEIRVNVMPQFQPVFQLLGHPRLGRRVTGDEVDAALAMARDAGLRNVWCADAGRGRPVAR